MEQVSWRVVEGLFARGDPIYTLSKTAELLLAVGEPLAEDVSIEQLQVALIDATAAYGTDYYRQTHSVNKAEAEAAAVAQACKQLLSTLGIRQRFKGAKGSRPAIEHEALPRSLGVGGLYAMAALDGAESGRGAVLEAMHTVARLEDWAERLAARHRAKGDAMPPAVGTPDNEALDKFLETLTLLYFRAYNEFPRALNSSRNRGDWKDGCRAEGVDPASYDDLTVEYQETGQASPLADLYRQGEPIPTGFNRFLCELMFAVKERGLPAPPTVGAIAKAWRRWKAAQEDTGSDYDCWDKTLSRD